jgi:hypothetical protein
LILAKDPHLALKPQMCGAGDKQRLDARNWVGFNYFGWRVKGQASRDSKRRERAAGALHLHPGSFHWRPRTRKNLEACQWVGVASRKELGRPRGKVMTC